MKNLFMGILLLFTEIISVFGQETDSTLITKSQNGSSFPLWIIFLILIIVITIVAFLIYRLKNPQKPKYVFEIPKDWKKKNQQYDFSDVFKGVSGDARILYRELIIKCHPDRFVGDNQKIEIATTLSGEITRNRHNYSKLSELKTKAQEELGIDFE